MKKEKEKIIGMSFLLNEICVEHFIRIRICVIRLINNEIEC